jgi:tetratricopeptide (TPR) repeat protein
MSSSFDERIDDLVRKIAFLGNCQMQALKSLYDRFVVGYTGDQTIFLPSYKKEPDGVVSRDIADVTLFVEQIQELEQTTTLLDGHFAERCQVPLVSAAFLWPFAGEQHPSNASHPYLDGGPYPGELGDGFLNRLINRGLPANDAVAEYRTHQFAEKSLNRRFELSIDRQRSRDEATGFSIASEIERFFRTDPLFFSPHHPGLRISRLLAEQCFNRIGVPQRCIDTLNIAMSRSPFPGDQLPVHPAVAAHFKLTYITEHTTYPLRGEGRFTWEQWVLRYMQYAWEPNLFEAAAVAESDPTRARDLMCDVLHRLPHTPLGRMALARALSRLGNADDAAKESAKAISLDPDDPTVWRVGALIATQRGLLDVARRLAVTAIAHDPADISNLNLLARVQEDLKDFASSEWTRRKVIWLVPHDAACHTALGTALMHQEDKLLEALIEYQRAIVIDPQHAGAHYGASIVLSRLVRHEESIEAVKHAIRLAPGVALYHSHLGHVLGRVGRRGEAILAFAHVLEFEPENAGVYGVLSDLLRQEGRLDEALRHIARAIEIEPRTVRFLTRLADILAAANRPSEAIVPLRQALELQSDNGALRLRLGSIYAGEGRLEEAVMEFEEAARLDPKNAEPLQQLSRILERKGDLSGSQVLTNHARALQPDKTKLSGQKQERAADGVGRRFHLVPPRDLAQTLDCIIPATRSMTPKCLVYTNFMQLNPEFGAHHLARLYIDRERHLPEVSIYKLDPMVILAVPNGEEFIPFCGDKVVVDQVRPGWNDHDLQNARDACVRQDRIEGPALLIARYGIRTWGHWLGELLPKLVAVEAFRPNHFRYVLPNRFISDPQHATALESLSHYGIGLDRIILVSERTSYAASDLHVVTPAWSPDHMINPTVAELMRTQIAGCENPEGGPERVALLRRGARTRRLANLSEVELLLERRGWTILDIEAMNFPQQVDLFRNAKSIVSVLGSGLTGLIYSPLGVKILTLAPSHWGDLFFFAMMQERNAIMADIRGSSLATEPGMVATASFTVDLTELEIGLAALNDPEGSSQPRKPATLYD